MENLIQSLPSIINDPFQKQKITRIYVAVSQNWLKPDTWTAVGNVEFKNGNTTGEQKFTGKTFDEVVLQISALIETLKTE